MSSDVYLPLKSDATLEVKNWLSKGSTSGRRAVSHLKYFLNTIGSVVGHLQLVKSYGAEPPLRFWMHY